MKKDESALRQATVNFPTIQYLEQKRVLNLSDMIAIAFLAVLILFALILGFSSWYVYQLKEKFPGEWRELGEPEPWQVFGEKARVVSREVWRSRGAMTGLKLLINALTVAYYLALLLLVALILLL